MKFEIIWPLLTIVYLLIWNLTNTNKLFQVQLVCRRLPNLTNHLTNF